MYEESIYQIPPFAPDMKTINCVAKRMSLLNNSKISCKDHKLKLDETNLKHVTNNYNNYNNFIHLITKGRAGGKR